MWNTLCSRKFAVYALLALLLLLVCSALLPSELTLSEQKWYALQKENPTYFRIAASCATPYLVKTPFFAAVSLLLFLSTFACTWQRLRNWQKTRESEFSRERSFSFSRELRLCCGPDRVRRRIEELLGASRWQGCAASAGPGQELFLAADKGRSGFWGSILFHCGLLCCFLAGPVTLLTGVAGQLVLTEGVELPLQETVVATGKTESIPKVSVLVHDLRGLYFQGEYKSDFRGVLAIRDAGEIRELPFGVNRPGLYHGFQFSLHQFGYAPRLVVDAPASDRFDFYLNLKHPEQGDSFHLGGGVRALVLFFPDFIREGDKVGSRSRDPVNPVTLVKLFRGEREVFKGLFRPGDEEIWEDKRIRVTDYRRWVTLNVTKEQGVLLVMIGSLLVVAGLLARFLSNERRVEFELLCLGEQTMVTVRGYSRYYPAFLEKEVLDMARKLEEGVEPVPASMV